MGDLLMTAAVVAAILLLIGVGYALVALPAIGLLWVMGALS